MLQYKRIDIALQVLTLVITLLVAIGPRNFGAVYGLMFLGMLQVISAIVHFFFGRIFWNSLPRKIWYFLSVCSLLVLVFSFSASLNESITILFSMIFVTALLGIYYLIICITEVKRMSKKQ